MLFIYWFEGHPAYAERIGHILARMEQRGDSLCTSVFTVGETLAGLFKSREPEKSERMRDAFRPPFVQVLPFTMDSANHYANIRARLGVSPPDAIHLACAAQTGVDLFLTNDRRLVGQIVPGIQFIASLESELF
jgi:predicted nucleic acid-binding protein